MELFGGYPTVTLHDMNNSNMKSESVDEAEDVSRSDRSPNYRRWVSPDSFPDGLS